MNKHYKLFVIFAIVTTMIFALKLYDENETAKNIKELSIKYEAKAIADLLVAFRSTYQAIFIKNHTMLNESNIELLPVRTTNEISKLFSSLNTQSKTQTVSDRPRNPTNMANTRQLEAIEYFKKYKEKESLFINNGDKYYYSQPLYITEACLKCHGKKEDAPDVVRNKYDKAYDYKLGDLRGIIDIEVSQTKLANIIDDDKNKKIFFILVILFLILGITFIYAYYNKEQENKIQALNKRLKQKVSSEIEKNREQYEQLVHKSRLAQVGEMISMIAHQWRQPLAAISADVVNMKVKIDLGALDLEKKEELEEIKYDFSDKLDDIEESVQLLSTTIDDFRNFYKPNKKSVSIKLEDAVLKSMRIIKASLENDNIEIIQKYESEEKFDIYDNEMVQVILNILHNAQDNFAEKKTENPCIRITTKDNILSICDNGGGIPENIMDSIFDPHFSTKDEKKGTGLGLYMSKTIIEEHHGGKLHVKNKNGGVCFTIEL